MMNEQTESQVRANEKENIYPPYFYLWHLVRIGVIKICGSSKPWPDIPACPTLESTLWQKVSGVEKEETNNNKKKTKEIKEKKIEENTIAIIDTGVNHVHPNLQGRVNTNCALDLASHEFGVKYKVKYKEGVDKYPDPIDHLGITQQHLTDLKLYEKDFEYVHDTNIKRQISDLSDGLVGGRGLVRELSADPELFPAHGTAIAGITSGTTVLPKADDRKTSRIKISLRKLEKVVSQSDKTVSQSNQGTAKSVKNASQSDVVVKVEQIMNSMPYFGVDPYSQVIPITTSFNPDPKQLLCAFLYAYKLYADKKKVDVILVPRGIDKKNETTKLIKQAHSLKKYSEEFNQIIDMLAWWHFLEQAIIRISSKIPIVCAAGNSGESRLAYPASLAKEPKNGVIAVGSVNNHGYRSGYSNYDSGLTVVAPSDDQEVYNKHQFRMDEASAEFCKHCYPEDNPKKNEPKYSHQSIVTLDIPGNYGYAAENIAVPYSMALENPELAGGFYSLFGGTSAASAIVAGSLSLILRKLRLEKKFNLWNGNYAKELIRNHASTDCLKYDICNENDKDDLKNRVLFKKQFGSGMINVEKVFGHIDSLPATHPPDPKRTE